MPKILFTSPCGPYPKYPVNRDPIDYFYYRNTCKQKMFQLRSFQSWHSLHFLAQNIPVPSVVLENPGFKTFQDEVNTGNYQLVAIGFTILLSKKVLEMVSWIKEAHPETEIVLGGYGTAIFEESFEISLQLKQKTDYICYGEGVSFLRELIFRKWGVFSDKPLRQSLLPAENSFFRTRISLFRQIIVTGGLGCVYGCSFCATSAQFRQKYIGLFTAGEIVQCLEEQSQKYPEIKSAIIYEEDFLIDRKKVLAFSEAFIKSGLHEHGMLLTVFASLNSVERYSAEELTRCGIGTLFIGVESMHDEVITQEGLAKRRGEIASVFDRLHHHGINTLGSLVIGWDSQTLETAVHDSEQFIRLNPTFYQVVPLHVVPGTQLWEKMKAENRISENYQVDKDGISDFNFGLKHYSHQAALKLVDKTYTGLVDEGGPWPFRLFETQLNGFVFLKNKSEAIFRERAKIYKSMLFPLCLLAFSSRVFFHGQGFGKRWKSTMKLFFSQFKMLFLLSAFLSPLIVFALALISIYGNLRHFFLRYGDQPDFIRREYGST